jgi:lipid-A-disaccharide synthase
MRAERVSSLGDIEQLSVMGVDGLLGKLGDILRLRRDLSEHWTEDRPDVFIGVDAPDFNLGLEKRLKAAGIPTVHFCSPTVWAWRGYRIRGIRKAVNLMLTLFPFEADYYKRNNVPVAFVGHPLAQELNPKKSNKRLRKKLLGDGNRLVALLPGSRGSEVSRLGSLFVDTARALHAADPGLRFVIPAASEKLKVLIQQSLREEDTFISMIDGNSQGALFACDLTLLASGTAALEAAMLAKPMVVAYKVSWLTYCYVRATAQVEHVSMPNHLLAEPIVTECLQGDATVQNLVREIESLLNDDARRKAMVRALASIHRQLDLAASENAAEKVIQILA